MISVNLRPLATATLATLLVGCASLSSAGKDITETALEITPTESVASFSRSSQSEITSLALSPDQLGDPSLLETSPSVTALTPAGRRSLLLAEAWQLRGQNDVEVPIATSLERYLRAAHFAYEGIFAGDVCSESSSQLCSDLYAAYNRSTREIARLTNNGRELLAGENLTYIVDLQADGDPLTVNEWELTLDDYTPPHAKPAFGAGGVACQTVRADNAPQEITAQRCAPISFVVLFDDRTGDARSRAHLVAYDSFERDTISLHGHEIALQTNSLSAWNQIFTPTSSPAPALSCLSNISSSLPTVVLMTIPSQSPTDWAVIASALSADSNLVDHYNFCSLTSVAPTGANQPSDALAAPLLLLTPRATKPLQVILVSEGADNEQFARSLKQNLKDQRQAQGALVEQSPLALAGSLALPSARPPTASTPPPPATTVAELSRHSTVALRDITRLLTKLADSEEGVFGALSRSRVPHGPDVTLSPVM